MKNALLCFLFVFALGACSQSGNGTSAEEVAKGKTIYLSYCVACHGTDGKLALNGAKDFAESTMTIDERIAIIKNGKNMMTAFGGLLKEEEIKQVAAYTIQLTKGE